MSMKISQKGIDFIAKEEGLVLKPYLCSALRPTIGLGSTRYGDGTPVKMTDKPITKEEAYKLFNVTVKNFEAAVNALGAKLTQNQFDALVSLCYNIGVGAFAKSTVAKRVKANPNDPTIGEAIQLWKNASGKPILLARRKRESALYYSK